MRNVKTLLATFCVALLFFVLQKPVFLLYHWSQTAAEGGFCQSLSTAWHGLPMDMCVAGYFTALPALVLLVATFVKRGPYAVILRAYFAVASLLIALVFVADLELYTHWGFRLDSTVFAYAGDPKGATASVSFGLLLVLVLGVLVWAALEYLALDFAAVRPFKRSGTPKKIRLAEMILMPLLMGLMFIAIRGGVGTSTMNVGRAYFSSSTYLNQAACNPCFTLIYSLSKPTDFGKQYRFMDDAGAHALTASILDRPDAAAPQDTLLTTDRPNIIFIVLESFGHYVLDRPDVTPNLNRLAAEGVLFDRMYASSFRTDRGLVAALSGYPAQPTMSVIRYPAKVQKLPSMVRVLNEEAGYSLSFLYGGDVDFASMRSFLVTQGITDVLSDKDFPSRENTGKWGVPDHFAFERFYREIAAAGHRPYFKAMLTLSSHEPFEVPSEVQQFPGDVYLNSVWYTDRCIGAFVDSLKASPEWGNTLLVFVPDHDMFYPKDIKHYEPRRHDIFMIWAGGAVRGPRKFGMICSQTDIAATLLGQLGLDYSLLPFSRNILRGYRCESAFYDFPDGFGFVTPQGYVSYDCASGQLFGHAGPAPADSLLTLGKAYLQTLYDDIAAR